MAITTYDELKAAAANWQHRSNGGFAGRVPEFIALFEANANATLRLRDNEAEAGLVATVGSSFIDLPEDFHEPVSLRLAADRRRLVFTEPDALPWQPLAGPSHRWTVEGSHLQTDRDADQAYAYALRYHRKYDLAADGTNVLLARYPNVYLYGTLLEAAPYVRDLAIVTLWQARYDRAAAALEKAEAADKKHGTLAVDSALLGAPR